VARGGTVSEIKGELEYRVELDKLRRAIKKRNTALDECCRAFERINARCSRQMDSYFDEAWCLAVAALKDQP